MNLESHEYDLKRLASFRLGKTLFAIDIHGIHEVLTLPKVRPVPGAPAYMKGIFNLRGQIIPLIDFRLLMGLPDLSTSFERVIIHTVRGHHIGFIVDEMSRVLQVNKHSILPPPPVLLQGLDPHSLRGVYVLEKDENLILLDLEHLLSKKAAAKIAQTANQS